MIAKNVLRIIILNLKLQMEVESIKVNVKFVKLISSFLLMVSFVNHVMIHVKHALELQIQIA